MLLTLEILTTRLVNPSDGIRFSFESFIPFKTFPCIKEYKHRTLEMWEELKPGLTKSIDWDDTFDDADMSDGDIICVQPRLTSAEVMYL
jgi:hypothetical protein